MSEERAFKNPFPDYQQNSLDIADANGKLNEKNRAHLDSFIQNIFSKLESSVEDDGDYSIYTGSAGQAYLLLHLHEKLSGSTGTRFLRKALDWLKPAIKRLKNSRSSFLCGDSGPLALSAVIYSKIGDVERSKDYISRIEHMCSSVCRDKNLPDELLYGRCGYLSALLFLQHHLGPSCVNKSVIIEVVDSILKSGQNLAKSHRCSHSLMYEWHDKPYLGAAHGLAGIYFMLLQVKEPEVQKPIQDLVRPCVDYMLSLRLPCGNYPSSLGSSSGGKLVHWCHGAPGWVHMFSLAYRIFKDDRYLQAAENCADVVWKRGLLRKGYGICHGTSGNAYTFLALYKLTKDQKYLYRAWKFAEWIFDYGKHGCRIADRPYSLFEGMAGTVHFLVDLLDPSNAMFPAFEFK